ncbi:MAG: terminase small subunit [Xanthobacteraceae bacterium]|uniref:terminase small subunit n=1 Tax=Pseudolabrys sp. TaxID=1960880 RepID=UPI003D0E4FF1
MTLTARQARFVKEYFRCLNGTQAAIAAGYSQRTARAIASENLRKPSIRGEIANLERSQQERLSAERREIIDELAKIVDFKISSLFDEHGRVLPVSQWPPEAASVVVEFKCYPTTGKSNRTRISLKMQDRLKALERLGDMLGAFNRRKNAKRKSSSR